MIKNIVRLAIVAAVLYIIYLALALIISGIFLKISAVILVLAFVWTAVTIFNIE